MDKVYYDIFEQKTREELTKIVQSVGLLADPLPLTDNFYEKWAELAPSYFADAVREIADYPVVSLAWAGYVGMAIAHWWDSDWEGHKDVSYQTLYGKQGFDDMDEHIAFDLLKLDKKTAEKIEDALRACGETAMALIRHENIEPQTPEAFYVYARAVKVLYETGAMMELARLGYKNRRLL